MTISLAGKTMLPISAFHNKEPRIPYDNDAPEGFMLTLGFLSTWLSKDEAARLGRYLLELNPGAPLNVAIRDE